MNYYIRKGACIDRLVREMHVQPSDSSHWVTAGPYREVTACVFGASGDRLSAHE